MAVTDVGAALLRALDPETAHGLAIRALQLAPLPASADAPQRGLSVDADGVMRFEDGAVGWP